jgi:hypothetical protein
MDARTRVRLIIFDFDGVVDATLRVAPQGEVISFSSKRPWKGA